MRPRAAASVLTKSLPVYSSELSYIRSIRVYRGFDSIAGFFEGMMVVSETVTLRGSKCWRQVSPGASQRHPSAHPDRDIPGRPASPQSLLPFLAADLRYPIPVGHINHSDTAAMPPKIHHPGSTYDKPGWTRQMDAAASNSRRPRSQLPHQLPSWLWPRAN